MCSDHIMLKHVDPYRVEQDISRRELAILLGDMNLDYFRFIFVSVRHPVRFGSKGLKVGIVLELFVTIWTGSTVSIRKYYKLILAQA